MLGLARPLDPGHAARDLKDTARQAFICIVLALSGNDIRLVTALGLGRKLAIRIAEPVDG